MARTALVPTVISRAGVSGAKSAANVDGHSISNPNGDVFIVVDNGSASPITVTIPVAKVVDGQTIAAKTVSVPASQSRLIGPFPVDTYNQSGQVVNVDFSAVTTVTVAAHRLIAGV